MNSSYLQWAAATLSSSQSVWHYGSLTEERERDPHWVTAAAAAAVCLVGGGGGCGWWWWFGRRKKKKKKEKKSLMVGQHKRGMCFFFQIIIRSLAEQARILFFPLHKTPVECFISGKSQKL